MLYQRVKPTVGADGTAVDVSAVAPMPIVPGHPSTKVLTNATISAAASGDNTLVAAVASQTTRIFALYLVVDAAVNIKFIRGTTDLTGVMVMKAGGSICLDFTGEPHFVTGTNEAFIANLSAAIGIRGWIQYETST